MKRRLFSLVITVFAVMLLTGCNSDQKDVTAAAEGFLDAIVKNDREAASEYATEEFMKSDEMMLMDPQYLTDALKKTNALQLESDRENALLAAGRIEDVSQVVIAAQKADIALQLTLQMRNRAMSAYQEIMRMQV